MADDDLKAIADNAIRCVSEQLGASAVTGDGAESLYQSDAYVLQVLIKPRGWMPSRKRKAKRPVSAEPHPDDDATDLPPELADAKRSEKRVYRLVRQFRESRGRDIKLKPADLFELERAERKSDALSESAIGHALKVLKDHFEVIIKEKGFGYRLPFVSLPPPTDTLVTPAEDFLQSDSTAENDPVPWC